MHSCTWVAELAATTTHGAVYVVHFRRREWVSWIPTLGVPEGPNKDQYRD